MPQHKDPILQLLQEKRSLPGSDPEDTGYTTEEMALLLKVSVTTVRTRLQMLKLEGLLRVGHAMRESLDGRMRKHTIYEVASDAASKATAKG